MARKKKGTAKPQWAGAMRGRNSQTLSCLFRAFVSCPGLRFLALTMVGIP
jgi:hypothetical protein